MVVGTLREWQARLLPPQAAAGAGAGAGGRGGPAAATAAACWEFGADMELKDPDEVRQPD